MTRRAKLEALLQQDPDDVFLRYALALQCASDGDDAAALTGFDELLARDPHYVPAWFQLAQLLARTGNVERSRQVLQQGIQVAQAAGDSHALGEMQGFLAQLGS